MSAPFHSPAPWTVNASGGARTIVAADRSTVAVVIGSNGAAPFEVGNGALMAAAPELLEELVKSHDREWQVGRGRVPPHEAGIYADDCPGCHVVRKARGS